MDSDQGDEILVAVGTALGVAPFGPDAETDAEELPWFRQGGRIMQIVWPAYVFLSTLARPMTKADADDFCQSAELDPEGTLVSELLADGLAVVIPDGDDPKLLDPLLALRPIPHSYGVGRIAEQPSYFVVVPVDVTADQLTMEQGAVANRGTVLPGLDYALWSVFDGSRTLGQCVELTSAQTLLPSETLKQRLPALLRELLKKGLITLDEPVV